MDFIVHINAWGTLGFFVVPVDHATWLEADSTMSHRGGRVRLGWGRNLAAPEVRDPRHPIIPWGAAPRPGYPDGLQWGWGMACSSGHVAWLLEGSFR